MQKLRAVLFPHSYVSEANLKRVLSFFEKVTLFQPWFLEKVPPMAEEWPDLIEVANPSEACRPEQGFKGLLAEYRQWMRSNYEQGLASFAPFALGGQEADSSTWEIRSMIRHAGKPGGEEERAKSLKWHLALHLAEEIEEEQQSAVDLLKSMNELGSPLKGALEEEDVPSVLGDLPGLGSEHLLSEDRLAQVLNAWFGLFHEKALGEDLLMTINPQVMKYVMETWEEFGHREEGSRPLTLTLASQDLSPLGRPEFLEKREALFAHDPARKALADFCRDPGGSFSEDRELGCRPDGKKGCLCWRFAHFSHVGDRRIPKRYEFIKQLSGKTIGLVGEA